MHSRRLTIIRRKFVRYFFLLLCTIVFTLPMVYMISTSLRPNGALYEYPPHFFPRPDAFTLDSVYTKSR